MTTNDHFSKTQRDLEGIVKGIPQVLLPGKTFFFKGINYDQAGFLQLVAAVLAPYENVDTSRTQLAQGIVTRDANEPQAQQFVSDVKAAAVTNYGENTPQFDALGFKPNWKQLAAA